MLVMIIIIMMMELVTTLLVSALDSYKPVARSISLSSLRCAILSTLPTVTNLQLGGNQLRFSLATAFNTPAMTTVWTEMRIANNLQQHLTWLLKEKANTPSRREKGITPSGTQNISSSAEGVEQRLKSSGESTSNLPNTNIPSTVPRALPSSNKTVKISSSATDIQNNQENIRFGLPTPSTDFKDSGSEGEANHKFAVDMPVLNLSKSKETPRRLLTNRLNQESHDAIKRQEEPLEIAKSTHPGMNLMDNWDRQVASKSANCEWLWKNQWSWLTHISSDTSTKV